MTITITRYSFDGLVDFMKSCKISRLIEFTLFLSCSLTEVFAEDVEVQLKFGMV
jgi:hypothetical protein